jgi:hypothetical protein
MREDKIYAGFLLVDRQIKNEAQKIKKIPQVGAAPFVLVLPCIHAITPSTNQITCRSGGCRMTYR